MSERQRKPPKDPFAKELAELEGKLTEFRRHYSNLSKREKAELKRWLDRVVLLNRHERLSKFGPPGTWGLQLSVTVSRNQQNDDREEPDRGEATVPPVTLRKAISAWEEGDGYMPPNVFGTI